MTAEELFQLAKRYVDAKQPLIDPNDQEEIIWNKLRMISFMDGCEIGLFAAKSIKTETHEGSLIIAEELFDKYSQYVDDNLDALQGIAGANVVRRSDFIKAIKEFYQLSS